MPHHKTFTPDEAKKIGDDLKIPWDKYLLEEFRQGLTVELEHGAHDPETDVTHDDVLLTGKIAWAHLKEIPDYYTRLARMEAEPVGEAEGRYWFRAKKFGWGWYPVSWQGWLVTLVVTILLVREAIQIDSDSHSVADTLTAFAIPFSLITSLLLTICYAKGEKPVFRFLGFSKLKK